MTYEEESAWLAGLFEGEGCFTTRRKWNEIRISIHMSDEDVIRRAAAIIGHKTIWPRVHSRQRKETYKTTWEFELQGDKAVTFAERILPYMGERRSARITFLLERASHRLTRAESGRKGAVTRWAKVRAAKAA
jgi:hypothetical protein